MIIVFCVIPLVMLFYLFHRPVDLKSEELKSSLAIAFLLSFIPTLLAGNLPYGHKVQLNLPKQAKWRRVLTKTTFVAGGCCLIIGLTLDLVAWISCQFVEPKIMQAEIMSIHTSSRSCTEWRLRFADYTEVRVCKTGPSQEWQERQIIEVSVRESALAYEVSYYRH